MSTPTAAQIEWWTGEKMVMETAADLRIEEFTKGPSTISEYLARNRYKQERRAKEKIMWKLWHVNRNPWIRYRLHQKVQCRQRNKYWRMWSYPNLRKAWATNRAKGERNRRERELRKRRAAILKSIELFKYSTRKDI